MQGETVKPGFLRQLDVAGNGGGVVRRVEGQRFIPRADVTVVPAIAVVPGKVVGQHQPGVTGGGFAQPG